GKLFYIGHGDGLGPGDRGYKFIKKVFRNKICQFLFNWIHPDLGVGLANFFSKLSRGANSKEDKNFMGEDKEFLVRFCKDLLSKGDKTDYFIFGHRHLPLDIQLQGNSRYINLGEWMNYCTYAVF